MSRRPRVRTLFLTTAAALLIGATGAACSSDDDPTSTPTATAAATSTVDGTATAEATTTPEATPDAATPATAETLSANDASIAELAAAFEAAGISNASRWAREVDEYRPYSEDDTDYAKLRGELAKYNPSPEVLEAIIAALHLP